MRLFAPILLALLACESSNAGPSDPRRDSAPVLDEAHLGWKAQACESCHDVPVVGHTETKSATCATCHGGNGACLADAPSVERAHDPAENCVSCHDDKHGFTAPSECANCHFADKGSVDCDSGPIMPGGGGLSNTLVQGCYDLSPGNTKAVPTKTALRAGEAAVEFTLKDRDGNPHTLSQLLATKPVALVFGAFT